MGKTIVKGGQVVKRKRFKQTDGILESAFKKQKAVTEFKKEQRGGD